MQQSNQLKLFTDIAGGQAGVYVCVCVSSGAPMSKRIARDTILYANCVLRFCRRSGIHVFVQWFFFRRCQTRREKHENAVVPFNLSY